MPPKWNEVTANPKYQSLPPEEQQKVKDRYFENVVKAAPSFQTLAPEEQTKVQERFYGPAVEEPGILEKTKRTLQIGNMIRQELGKKTAIPNMVIGSMTDPIVNAVADPVKEKIGKIRDVMQGLVSKIPDPQTPSVAKNIALGAPKAALSTAVDVGEFAGKAAADALLTPGGAALTMATAGVRPPKSTGIPGKTVTEPALPAPKTGAAIPEPPPVSPEIAGKVAVNSPAAGSRTDIFGQQLDKFNVSDDAKAIFHETSEMFKDQIDVARRGKIDWKGTQELAQNLGMNEKDLIGTTGKAFTAEQLEAAKGLTGASLQRVESAKKAYLASQSDADLLTLQKEISRHAQLQQGFLAARAESGRALQILRKVTDPAEKNIETVFEALGGKEVTQEMAKKLAAIDPTDIPALNTFIRGAVKATTPQKLQELWVNSILSSPLTQRRNAISNLLFTAAKVPEKVVTAGLDKAASVFTGKRTAYLGEAPREAFAFFQGMTDGVRRGIYALKTGVSPDQAKLELTRLPALEGKVGDVVRLPSRFLVAADEFAKAVASRMELAARTYRTAKAEGLTGKALANRIAELQANPTDEILGAAKNEALTRTFQNDPGAAVMTLMSLRDKVPGLRYVLPFIKTPANIAARGVERSPLGWYKVIKGAYQGVGQEQLTKDAANAILGSTVAGSLAYYAATDRMTAGPPKDPGERDRFYRSGRMPYSIRVGNKWYSYAGFEPLSLVMGLTASAVQAAKDSGGEVDPAFVQAATLAIPKYMLEQTFLSGLKNMVDALEDPGRYGSKMLTQMASGFIPFSGMNRFVAQRFDNTVRDPQTFLDALKVNIPGASKTVLPKLTAYGDPAKRPSPGVLTVTSPAKVNKLDQEDVELDRIQGFPSKTLAGVKLDGKEYAIMLRLSGQNLKRARAQMYLSPGWRDSSPEARKRLIENVQLAARRDAQRQIFPRVMKRVQGEDRRKLEIYGAKFLGTGVQQ